ncbi:MAG TPA: cytochrome c [Methylomirabilota bacterium]|jgi:mono/diheme cytochrome c family protein|nr:cytochrome c [Methylomirabilota bacterium]
MSGARPVVALLLVAVGVAACSEGSKLGPEAERGRQIYLAQCTACHAADPAQNGPLGPAVKGSSRELVEARVLRAAYPPGYAPKRTSAIMQPMPQLAGEIDALAAFLR